MPLIAMLSEPQSAEKGVPSLKISTAAVRRCMPFPGAIELR